MLYTRVLLPRQRNTLATLQKGALVLYLVVSAAGLMGCRSAAPDTGEQLRGIQLPSYVPGTTDSTQLPLRVMTYNIRYNNPDDKQWIARRGRIASMIQFHEPAVIGTQEGQLHQLMDLEDRLADYERVGVGRKSGGGEFSALLYQPVRLELLEYNTFWLSEVPGDPESQGWDAAFPRIATWARFRDRLTEEVFFILNTHFDHRGRTARVESARLIRQRVTELVETEPVAVMGDFNAKPHDRPIQLLTSTDSSVRLRDAKTISSSPHYGPTSTFNAFRTQVIKNHRIDYIFVREGIRVLRHGHLSSRWRGGFPSDHLPVVADLVL